MFLNNEPKIVVPKGWSCKKKNPDDSQVTMIAPVTSEDTNRHHQEEIPKKLVRASALSDRDYFLAYEPKTPAEKAFKNAVEKVIKAGVKDFYRPTLDPSFDGDGQICYQAGMKPAVGKSYEWWKENAKKLGYRLGTYSEYIAFLAVLIKEMVASGKSLEWAWNAVCNDSKELGHYWNSSNAKYEFESTGNREVCGWYDLANTYKILAEEKYDGGYWLASGYYFSDHYPLVFLQHYNHFRNYVEHDSGTGWLVLS